jgi:multimeric flavodoxin WrbA
MPNKIVFIQGSPRKNGNTRAMAAIAIEAARLRNSEVFEIDATQLEFKEPGCISCQKCQQSDKFLCAIDDQAGRAVATLPDYDVIVVATPIYWWSYTAQIKILIDRMYSLSKFSASGEINTLLAGKTFALLATGGGPLKDNLDILELQWKNPADMLGCPFYSCLFPDVSPEPGSLKNNPSAVEKARAFGQLLTSQK